jgi:hypothetical protein
MDKKDTPLGRKASTRSNKSTRQPEKPPGQQTSVVVVGPRPESLHVAKIFKVQAPMPLTPKPTGNGPSLSLAIPVHVKALILPGMWRDGSPVSAASATESAGDGGGH